MGLANRVVADGNARAAAEELAAEIAGFPQNCLRADRASALSQWSLDMATALQREGKGGFPVVFEEALEGAGRFASGEGRHGRF